MGATTNDSDRTGTEERLERLEAVVDRQQELLEEQRTIIDRLRERLDDHRKGDRSASRVSRRSLLKAAGLVGLAGYGTGRVAADPQGQVGSSGDPLHALYTQELNGGVTGDRTVTDLTGTGLDISDGTLGVVNVVTSGENTDYEVQKNGSDTSGVINFKT